MISITPLWEGVRRIDWRGAALDIMDVRALIHNDERPLELPHLFGINAEIGLERVWSPGRPAARRQTIRRSRTRRSSRQTYCQPKGLPCRSIAEIARDAAPVLPLY